MAVSLETVPYTKVVGSLTQWCQRMPPRCPRVPEGATRVPEVATLAPKGGARGEPLPCPTPPPPRVKSATVAHLHLEFATVAHFKTSDVQKLWVITFSNLWCWLVRVT